MKKSINLMMFLILTQLLACATSRTRLTEEAQDIRILEHEKGHGCKLMDKIIGLSDKGSEELATNHARNLAAHQGADAIYVKETVQNSAQVKVFANIYKCD